MPKNVIVLGMARSGTSLTASIFANKGYYASTQEDIVPADHMNPTGYWEARNLLTENETILKSTGFKYDNTWIYEEITADEIAKLNDIKLNEHQIELIDIYNSHSPWVWKDNRLCYTLRVWWPHLDQSNTAVILVKRNHEAIFQSFVRVGWRQNNPETREATFKRIRAHLENAEQTLNELSIPYTTVDYSDYKNRPEAVLGNINRLLDLDLTIENLNYRKSYDHYSLIGRIGTIIDIYSNKLSPKAKKRIKSCAPEFLLKLLYPERYR